MPRKSDAVKKAPVGRPSKGLEGFRFVWLFRTLLADLGIHTVKNFQEAYEKRFGEKAAQAINPNTWQKWFYGGALPPAKHLSTFTLTTRNDIQKIEPASVLRLMDVVFWVAEQSDRFVNKLAFVELLESWQEAQDTELDNKVCTLFESIQAKAFLRFVKAGWINERLGVQEGVIRLIEYATEKYRDPDWQKTPRKIYKPKLVISWRTQYGFFGLPNADSDESNPRLVVFRDALRRFLAETGGELVYFIRSPRTEDGQANDASRQHVAHAQRTLKLMRTLAKGSLNFQILQHSRPFEPFSVGQLPRSYNEFCYLENEVGVFAIATGQFQDDHSERSVNQAFVHHHPRLITSLDCPQPEQPIGAMSIFNAAQSRLQLHAKKVVQVLSIETQVDERSIHPELLSQMRILEFEKRGIFGIVMYKNELPNKLTPEHWYSKNHDFGRFVTKIHGFTAAEAAQYFEISTQRLHLFRERIKTPNVEYHDIIDSRVFESLDFLLQSPRKRFIFMPEYRKYAPEILEEWIRLINEKNYHLYSFQSRVSESIFEGDQTVSIHRIPMGSTHFLDSDDFHIELQTSSPNDKSDTFAHFILHEELLQREYTHALESAKTKGNRIVKKRLEEIKSRINAILDSQKTLQSPRR